MQDPIRLWHPVFRNRVSPPGPSMPITNLHEAIQLGADVKIEYFQELALPIQQPTFRLLPSVTISNPGPNAIISGIVVAPKISHAREFTSSPAIEWVAVNTTGMTQLLRFDAETRVLVASDMRLREITWYVSFGWREVFNSNQAVGFRDLVESVKKGTDVKIRYTRPGGIVWFRNLPSVVIREDTDERVDPEFVRVAGMVADIPDTEEDENGRRFAEPFAHEWHLFTTDGARQLLKFDMATSQLIETDQEDMNVGWFVRDESVPG